MRSISKNDVFSSCFKFSILCWEHFQEDTALCQTRHKHTNKPESLQAEDFYLEGSQVELHIEKKVRTDKRKEAKTLRNKGKTYISPVTKKIVQSKVIGESCAVETCRSRSRK